MKYLEKIELGKESFGMIKFNILQIRFSIKLC
jgi:hypothetical protein